MAFSGNIVPYTEAHQVPKNRSFYRLCADLQTERVCHNEFATKF